MSDAITAPSGLTAGNPPQAAEPRFDRGMHPGGVGVLGALPASPLCGFVLAARPLLALKVAARRKLLRREL